MENETKTKTETETDDPIHHDYVNSSVLEAFRRKNFLATRPLPPIPEEEGEIVDERMSERVYESINSSLLDRDDDDDEFGGARSPRDIQIPPRMSPDSIPHFLDCVDERRRQFDLSGEG